MQMLIVAASTDKLALQTRGDATITLIVYAIICGNAAVSGLVSSYTTIPNVLFIMFVFGEPTTLSLPGDGKFAGWTLFTVLFLILNISYNGFNQVASSVVITMTADVSDYEVYRTGKYVPGMIGMYGLVLFGFICNLIAMKYYPLTKEKMEEIQGEIAAIKAQNAE